MLIVPPVRARARGRQVRAALHGPRVALARREGAGGAGEGEERGEHRGCGLGGEGGLSSGRVKGGGVGLEGARRRAVCGS